MFADLGTAEQVGMVVSAILLTTSLIWSQISLHIKLTKCSGDVETIKDNDLVHIATAIEAVQEDFRDMSKTCADRALTCAERGIRIAALDRRCPQQSNPGTAKPRQQAGD